MGSRLKKSAFLGRWRIVETDITFSEDWLGELRLIAIEAFLDYRVVIIHSPGR